MVVEVKEITQENVEVLLAKFKKRPKRTLADIYGKLKRGIDGLEYQKTMRNEWN
ncbi:hypothetical protein FACS1894199_08920 [Bacteroidia bacterium]|nr:hypothetical protein FACS1894199_08920 [Bacteroidia bacterium]